MNVNYNNIVGDVQYVVSGDMKLIERKKLLTGRKNKLASIEITDMFFILIWKYIEKIIYIYDFIKLLIFITIYVMTYNFHSTQPN